MSLPVAIDPSWAEAQPGTITALLSMHQVANPVHHDGIGGLAEQLEAELRSRYAGRTRVDIQASAPLPAYAAHYRRFGQRYHVGMQLESIALKGKSLPRVAALVEAMFIAELRHGVLTAGHDLDALTPPITLGVGSGRESVTMTNGGTTTVKAGDLYTASVEGVLSAVISGPSSLARIGPGTTSVVFVVYAPSGVEPERVERHLDEIESNVRLIAPGAITDERRSVRAGDHGE